MKHGQLVANTSMNETIYHCFDYISTEDEPRLVRKLRKESDPQKTHTVRELVLGAHLCGRGLNARYEQAVNSQTPDWSILDKGGQIKGIIEALTFHAPRAMDIEFVNSLSSNELWIDWKPQNLRRLGRCIERKIAKYKGLVKNHKIPFAVAVFSQFPAEVQLDELEKCLLDEDDALFKAYPELSGAILFSEGHGDYHPRNYRFEYVRNPKPLKGFDLP